MKNRTPLTKFLSLALALLMTLPLSAILCACGVTTKASPTPKQDLATPQDPSLSGLLATTTDEALSPELLAYNSGGYKTYQFSDSNFFRQVDNNTVGSKDCTAMQGMNVGTTYIYTAKIHGDNSVATIHRTNANNGSQIIMKYYSSLTATKTSTCNTLGHANEISVCSYTKNGTTLHYMYAATLNEGTALARMKIDGEALRFTGYFDLRTTAGESVAASAIRPIKSEGGYFYFFIKRGLNFYYCKIAQSANGGDKDNPTPVTCYKLFVIDTRNAIVAKSNSSYGTLDNVENWTNQGFAYNKTEKVLYVPIWDQFGDKSRNLILTYRVDDFVTSAALSATKNTSKVLFPCTLSFLITNSAQEIFEIESCGFRTGQSSTGDNKLYFNVNAKDVRKEGIYSINYNSGSGSFVPIATTEDNIVYTVNYNANGGKDNGEGNTRMLATRHVKGITTRLRENKFVRTGYDFIGWHLYRPDKTNGKWLYFDTDGVARWYAKGSQPLGSRLALYEDRRKVSALTSEAGDTITCYAQWAPKETSSTRFLIQYDANGGTGSMSPTLVTYGKSTPLATNTFTRAGYQFSGWIAYRNSDNAWLYKDKSTLADKWIPIGQSTSGYILKSYRDKTSVSKTSSVDGDVITFYAVWTKIDDVSVPASVTYGTNATFKGNITSDAHLYKVTVTIKNASGTTVATKTVSPFALSYNVSSLNSSVKTASLARGTYTYTVTATTVSGSNSTTTVTVLERSFKIV